MVCIPCFIIPLLLYIWHKFVQPILLRYWNPWEKKDAQGNVIKTVPDNPFQCIDGVCSWKGAKKKPELELKNEETDELITTEDKNTLSTSDTKKID